MKMICLLLCLLLFGFLLAEIEEFYPPELEDTVPIELVPGYSFTLPKNPTKAALFSAFVPGLGQIYNERYLKAAGVIAIQAALVGRTFHHDRRMKDFRSKRNEFERGEFEYHHYNFLYQDSYDSRQSFIFWVGASVFLSTMEAFVDAHLINFKDKKNEIRLKFEDQMLQVSIGF